jgi:hypothetical protein
MIINKKRRFLNRIENNYKSFFGFVVKLIFWTVVLTWLLPLSASLFLSTVNKSANLTINDFILFVTASFILVYTYETQKQAKASEKMAEYQVMPSVEMFLIYNKNNGGSCFAFYNLSSTPGIITFDLSLKQDSSGRGSKYGGNISYRIPPQGFLITASTFLTEKDLPKKMEIKKDFVVKVRATIVPDLNNVGPDIKRTYEKTYKLMDSSHDTLSDKRWDEESIGFPDILCFAPENINLKQSVEFVVKKYMEKASV